MNHSAVTISDCVACHGSAAQTSGWASWNAETKANGSNTALSAKGVFHTNVSTAPASCVSCHSNEKPTTTVPNTADGFTHATSYGTECATCHIVTANVGSTWTSGFFGHLNNSPKALGTCSPCHDSKHHNAGMLCTGCHSPTYPSASTTGSFGGKWDKP